MRDVERFAGDTLGSLARNLTATDAPRTEVIVIDDGSNDDTPAILAAASATCGWLTVLRNEDPVGLAGARNQGLRAASGRLLTFLDGDDWYGPGYLGALVAAIDASGVDFVRVGHIKTWGRQRRIVMPPEPRRHVELAPRSGILPADDSTMVDYPYMWAGIYQRRLLDAGLLECHDQLHTAEDRPWIWRLHRTAESYLIADVCGLFYRRGVPTALTSVGDARQLHYLDAFDLVFGELEADADADLLRPKAIRSFCAIVAHHLVNDERLAPDLRRDHRSRVATALDRLPADELAAVLDQLGSSRARLLREVLRTTAVAA